MHRADLHPASRRFAGVVTAVVAWLTAWAIGIWPVSTPAWTAAELGLVRAVNGREAPALDSLALAMNVAFAAPWSGWIAAGAVALVRRDLGATVRAAVVLGVTWWSTAQLKPVVARPRPDRAALPHPLLPAPSSGSYPSGHTAAAAAVAVMLCVAFRQYRSARTAVTLASVALVALVAWSRVHLGVHYPSDVLASALLAPVLGAGVAQATAPPARPGRPPASGPPASVEQGRPGPAGKAGVRET